MHARKMPILPACYDQLWALAHRYPDFDTGRHQDVVQPLLLMKQGTSLEAMEPSFFTSACPPI